MFSLMHYPFRGQRMANRKIRISPLQNAIMRLLEEAGEETIVTLLVTLGITDESDGNNRVAFWDALQGLIRLSYVYFPYDGIDGNDWAPVVLTPVGRDALSR